MKYQIISNQYADSFSVGEWEGQEEKAAAKFNQILDAIAELTEEYDNETFNNAAHYAWDNVGSDEDLPNYTVAQIKFAAESAL